MGRQGKFKMSLERLVKCDGGMSGIRQAAFARVKRFGRLMAAVVLGAASVAIGPAAVLGDENQNCCGWRYSGDYSYRCGCSPEPERYGYVYEPEAAGASLLIVPLAASLLSAPPLIGNHCVAASGVTCLLLEPSWIGDECICRGSAGPLQGLVQ